MYAVDIAAAARDNDAFRRVLHTTGHTQLVVMTLKPGEDIGAEVHEHNDQVLTFVEGSVKAEQTYPPLLHGEITIIGTRWPSPYAPATRFGSPAYRSGPTATVERPCAADIGGYGGTRWSKKPSFSS
jgi:hypothetical protein